MRRTCLAMLVCLAATTGTLAVPSSAVAVPDLLVCTFSLQTTSLTDIPGILVSNSQANGDALDDALSAIPGNQAGETGVIIESGAYSFATAPPFLGVPNQCVHSDVDASPLVGPLPIIGDPDHVDHTGIRTTGLAGSGTYDNVLCGTGTATGTFTLTVGGDGEIARATAPYTIAFAAGNGAGAGVGGWVYTTAGNPNPSPRPAAVAVVAHIEGKPATPGATACVNSDAADFNIAGVLVISTLPSLPTT